MERKKQGTAYLDVRWDSHGSPISPVSDECYFSTSNPVEEREQVFLAGNDLPEAWKDRGEFCIAELGFGAGLSFLLTWKKWLETADPEGTLEFVSFERAPLAPSSIREAIGRFPDLRELCEELLAAYPPPLLGLHRIPLRGNLRLTLGFGEVHELLPLLDFRADCWFGDGFSPAKNPEMWDAQLAALLTERSAPGATLATYSVARTVRDTFSATGWSVEKRAGCPPKREMLTGSLPSNRAKSPLPSGTAIILGGGIAGSAAAEALLRRGLSVTILEKEPQVAAGASGNPAGILMPHVSLDPDPISRFALKGYVHALAALQRIAEQYGDLPYSFCGVLRLASSERLLTLFENLHETGLEDSGILRRVSAAETREVCGAKSELPGIFFPGGGWVDPVRFTAAPLSSPKARVQFGAEVHSIRRGDNSWAALDASGETLAEADYLVIANSYSSTALEQCRWLPLEMVRGQLISQRSTPASKSISSVICFDGYILPERSNTHVIGATYDHGDLRDGADDEQSIDLLRRVDESVPGLGLSGDGILAARVSFRGMSRDRLPILGRLPVLESYSGISGWKESFRPDYYPGLTLSVGHGSRGLITAHLSAEIIISELLGETPAVESDLMEHLHAERYLTRLLKRGTPIDTDSASSWKVEYRRRSD